MIRSLCFFVIILHKTRYKLHYLTDINLRVKKIHVKICMYTALCTYTIMRRPVDMLVRIGDKIIDKQRIFQAVNEILEMRVRGKSQQEVASEIGVDRTFVSRLESLGEIRKGAKIALVGFPLKNCKELSEVAKKEGIEYCLLLSERERWDFLESRTGVQLFNEVMNIIAKLRQYDIVIFLGSNMRIKLFEALLDKKVIGISIGESPIAEDKYVEVQVIKDIMKQIAFFAGGKV